MFDDQPDLFVEFEHDVRAAEYILGVRQPGTEVPNRIRVPVSDFTGFIERLAANQSLRDQLGGDTVDQIIAFLSKRG